MPFGTITIGGVAYNEIQRGIYLADTVGFNDPRVQVKITPGTKANKANPPVTTASVTLLDEQLLAPSVDDSPKLERGIVTISFSATDGYPVVDLDATLGLLSTFLTEGNLNRIMAGGS